MIRRLDNSFLVFSIIVFALLLIFVVLPFFGFGIFSFDFSQKLSQQESIEKFALIQRKNNTINGLPSNLKLLEDYSQELALLLKESSGDSASIILTELETTTAFYYLLSALEESKFSFENCDKVSLRSSINYADTSLMHSKKAKSLFDSLSTQAKQQLRENQSAIIENYIKTASDLKLQLNELCGYA